MSGEHDPDLVLGHPGDQRVHGAVRVRRLGGAPQGQLAADRVQVGDYAAGLQRRGMRAGVEHVLGHHDVGGGERGVGGGLVARLPVEDVVVGLAGQVVTDHRGAGVQRPLGVDHGRQRLVLDVDELQGVAGRVAVLGDHERDLLALVADLVGGQHGLHVPGQGRHPGQVALGQGLAGDHRLDLGMGQRVGGVHGHDPGVRQRAAQHRAVQHARQLDVIHEPALAADEPRVLLARAVVRTHRCRAAARTRCGRRS